MSIFFVFSGQGAQKVGMGKDLYENSTGAKRIFEEADRTLDWKVSELCFKGPEDKLTESRYCQPAIYTMSCACLEAFKEKYPALESIGNAGLSLGEFAALYASKIFSFADGLKLVARRGELMDAACRETDGAMASVLGGDLQIIKEVCAQCDIDVANYNCPGQIVISGEKSKVATAITELKARGLRKVIALNVAGAYHSRLMQSAADKFDAVLNEVALDEPLIPICQNVTGAVSATIEDIRKNLVAQIAGSVLWEDCVNTLSGLNAGTMIEFGPGNVLTGLLRRIDPEIRGLNVNSLDSLNALELD